MKWCEIKINSNSTTIIVYNNALFSAIIINLM